MFIMKYIYSTTTGWRLYKKNHPFLTFSYDLLIKSSLFWFNFELILKEKNNRQQSYQYSSGKQNQNSRSILVEYVERGYQFNQFYDIAIENSGQPLLSFQCDNIAYKEINPLSISYRPQYIKKKMVSDYHVIRLINDQWSNYNIISRYNISRTNNINQ